MSGNKLARKVLFGSNYPAWPAKNCLENFESLNRDAATAQLFLL
jgi:predicted TIM-barrel fold metal-dependent hydrolase